MARLKGFPLTGTTADITFAQRDESIIVQGKGGASGLLNRINILICLLTLIASASSAQPGSAPQPPVKRVIALGHTEEIYSAQLSEKRALNIYLPEGYAETDTASYPVIYLLDGGVDEDFIHIVGLVQFSNFPWVNWLPKSIVVGIVNIDRKRDMTFPTTDTSDKKQFPTTGGSEQFIAFLEKELQPYIRQQYRTSGSNMLIGESLGGLLATEVLLKKPYLFNRYVIVSPSLWWDDGSLLKGKLPFSRTEPARHTDIYLAVGKEGLAPGSRPHVMEVDANLLADKIRSAQNSHIRLQFDYLPEENHATIMHQAVLNAFRSLYRPQVK